MTVNGRFYDVPSDAIFYRARAAAAVCKHIYIHSDLLSKLARFVTWYTGIVFGNEYIFTYGLKHLRDYIFTERLFILLFYLRDIFLVFLNDYLYSYRDITE